MNWCPGMTIAFMEKEAIKQSMRFYAGNKEQVCLALGISLRTLHSRLAEYKEEEKKLHEATLPKTS